MKRGRKQADTDTLSCGECKSATDEKRWLSWEKKVFCVRCGVDGLLKLKKWRCDHGYTEGEKT